MMLFFRNYFGFFSPTLLKSCTYCVYSFQKIETIRPHVHIADEVVSLISGDDSVVGSPMQWMLNSMCCYKTVDLY